MILPSRQASSFCWGSRLLAHANKSMDSGTRAGVGRHRQRTPWGQCRLALVQWGPVVHPLAGVSRPKPGQPRPQQSYQAPTANVGAAPPGAEYTCNLDRVQVGCFWSCDRFIHSQVQVPVSSNFRLICAAWTMPPRLPSLPRAGPRQNSWRPSERTDRVLVSSPWKATLWVARAADLSSQSGLIHHASHHRPLQLPIPTPQLYLSDATLRIYGTRVAGGGRHHQFFRPRFVYPFPAHLPVIVRRTAHTASCRTPFSQVGPEAALHRRIHHVSGLIATAPDTVVLTLSS